MTCILENDLPQMMETDSYTPTLFRLCRKPPQVVWEKLWRKVMHHASPQKAAPTTPQQFVGEWCCCEVLVLKPKVAKDGLLGLEMLEFHSPLQPWHSELKDSEEVCCVSIFHMLSRQLSYVSKPRFTYYLAERSSNLSDIFLTSSSSLHC